MRPEPTPTEATATEAASQIMFCPPVLLFLAWRSRLALPLWPTRSTTHPTLVSHHPFGSPIMGDLGSKYLFKEDRNLRHSTALTRRFDEITATVLLDGWIIWDQSLVGTLGACSVCVLTFLFPFMPRSHALPIQPCWCTLKPTRSAGSWASRTASTSWAAVPWIQSTLRRRRWSSTSSTTTCAPALRSSSTSVTPACSRRAHQRQDLHATELQLHCSMQENIRDKLRPISLEITHTIKPVPPRRHSASKRLEKLPPVLSVSPSNTLYSEV